MRLYCRRKSSRRWPLALVMLSLRAVLRALKSPSKVPKGRLKTYWNRSVSRVSLGGLYVLMTVSVPSGVRMAVATAWIYCR